MGAKTRLTMQFVPEDLLKKTFSDIARQQRGLEDRAKRYIMRVAESVTLTSRIKAGWSSVAVGVSSAISIAQQVLGVFRLISREAMEIADAVDRDNQALAVFAGDASRLEGLFAAIGGTMTRGDITGYAVKLRAANVEYREMQGLMRASLALSNEFFGTSESWLRMMTLAITTGRATQLAQAGLIVDLTGALDRYAITLGKARKELTEEEKIQARVNASLEAITKRLEAHTKEMSRANKVRQLSVAMAEYWEEMKKAAWNEVVWKVEMAEWVRGGMKKAAEMERHTTIMEDMTEAARNYIEAQRIQGIQDELAA